MTNSWEQKKERQAEWFTNPAADYATVEWLQLHAIIEWHSEHHLIEKEGHGCYHRHALLVPLAVSGGRKHCMQQACA
jgi:hypothetical protein